MAPATAKLQRRAGSVRGGDAAGGAEAAAPAAAEAGGGAADSVCALLTIVWSHFQVLYMWYALEGHGGQLWVPDAEGLRAFAAAFAARAAPDAASCAAYAVFFAAQLAMAQFMPGLSMDGLPVAQLGGRRLRYLCNAYSAFYAWLAVVAALHASSVWPVTRLADDFGRYMCITMVVGDLTSLWWYAYGVIREGGGTGRPLRDLFMGTTLNPRVGAADVKMVAEGRWSWLTLFLITVAHAAKQYEDTGRVSYEMAFMVLAHWLYANACAKGEHFIVTTWDMTTEKFGWMLNFWNVCGVPFVYCFPSVFLHRRPDVSVDSPVVAVYAVALVAAYWVWDVANFQKNDLRLRRNGQDEARSRALFPVMPGSRLAQPETIRTPHGELLVDGMYRYARKINYTMDVVMAFLWGAVTHFAAFLPFFYLSFFAPFIVHRWWRDDRRCAAKYGAHWEEYRRRVPYVFVPGVF